LIKFSWKIIRTRHFIVFHQENRPLYLLHGIVGSKDSIFLIGNLRYVINLGFIICIIRFELLVSFNRPSSCTRG
jgi:hypothetical protein